MSTKEQILEILEENRATFVSGEKLAEVLQVSRTSIWKGVKALKEQGHQIESFSQKGYRLSAESDRLSASGIRFFLNDDLKDVQLQGLKTVDSTNQEAKRVLLETGTRQIIILADQQTKGRGRFGRDFFSPPGSGIYMSIVLRPVPKDALLITIAAAVGISRAIKKLTGIEVAIKWVNDLYFKEQKIAGILTEGLTNFETGTLDYLIVGIGLNVMKPQQDFPEALKKIAGPLFSQKPENLTRNQLAAEIINQVMEIVTDQENQSFIEESFIEEYRRRSMVIGEKIEILRLNEKVLARVIGIDESGGLMVEYQNKTLETLYSGEISIRRMEK